MYLQSSCFSTYVIDGLVIKILLGNGGLDDLLLDLFAQLLSGDVRAVLGANNDRVHSLRYDSTLVMLIFYSNLGLRIRSEPRACAI